MVYAAEVNEVWDQYMKTTCRAEGEGVKSASG